MLREDLYFNDTLLYYCGELYMIHNLHLQRSMQTCYICSVLNSVRCSLLDFLMRVIEVQIGSL